MKRLSKIHKTEKTFIHGQIYIEFTCGCIFLDKEDQKRKKRSVFEIKDGKRTNRVFCPNHKNNSHLKHRFKICPFCKDKIIVAKTTNEGPCNKCAAFLKQEKAKEKTEKKKQKDCLQYGKPYELRKNEKIVSEAMCRNREYCISFIKRASTLIQCDKCPHARTDIFED
jgi:hypothetical protein